MMRILAVTNLYPTIDAPTSGTFIKQQIKGLKQIGLNVDVMIVDRMKNGRSSYLGLCQMTRSKVLDFQPDVVHVMYGGIMADKVTRAVKDRPVIVSFCGTDLLGQPLVGYISKLSAQYNVWASHRAAKRASGIVVKSKNLEDALPRDIARSKVRIIPNGVDLQQFKPMDKFAARQILGWSMETAVVLFATVRGHPRKRPELAREAIARIKGYDDKISFRIMQGVPHEQVPLWLNASDVLILTSVHEGSVNIVKEAMACNLPVVSVDVGDVRERLTNVRLCAVAEANPEALAEHLRVILNEKGRSNGRDYLAGLTLSAVAEQLKQFYTQVLESHRIAIRAIGGRTQTARFSTPLGS
jgi:glycosyltransferase involved in cell wall biosynthesis